MCHSTSSAVMEEWLNILHSQSWVLSCTRCSFIKNKLVLHGFKQYSCKQCWKIVQWKVPIIHQLMMYISFGKTVNSNQPRMSIQKGNILKTQQTVSLCSVHVFLTQWVFKRNILQWYWFLGLLITLWLYIKVFHHLGLKPWNLFDYLQSWKLLTGLLIGCGKKLKIMRKFLAILLIMRKHAMIMRKLHRIMQKFKHL